MKTLSITFAAVVIAVIGTLALASYLSTHIIPNQKFLLYIGTKPLIGKPTYVYWTTEDDFDKALALLYLDGNSHTVIAEVLGISESNVGTRMHRIKRKLQRSWRELAAMVGKASLEIVPLDGDLKALPKLQLEAVLAKGLAEQNIAEEKKLYVAEG